MKKITQVTLIAAVSALTSGPIFADNAPVTPAAQRIQDQNQTIGALKQTNDMIKSMSAKLGDDSITGFTQLETYLDAKYQQTMNWVIQQNTTPTPNLSAIEASNQATAAQQAATAAQQATEANLHNSLTQFFYAMYQNDSSVADKITSAEGNPFSKYLQNNSTLALSVGNSTQASDSLYVANIEGKGSDTYNNPNNRPWLAQPKTISNDFLNFGVLFSTPAYTTPAQVASAQSFIKYAAQSTENLVGNINFSKLENKPAALLAFKQNPVYQQFVLSIRSLLAIRSVSINMLNQLVAERTPVKGLGAAAGLTTDTASPLQVEAYQATHRVENPQWYQNMENASPATLQRETLIVLAEIERQNYQAHLDRERILAAITASNLQSSAASTQAMLLQESSKLNDAINNAVSGTTKPPVKTQQAPVTKPAQGTTSTR